MQKRGSEGHIDCAICGEKVNSSDYAKHVSSKHAPKPTAENPTSPATQPARQTERTPSGPTRAQIPGKPRKVYSGETSNAGAPILGAKFWEPGRSLSGKVLREFQTLNGPCFVLELDRDIKVNGDLVSPQQEGEVEGNMFSVGSMKGFNMALTDSGLDKLVRGDVITITCTGKTDTGKGNPRVDFRVEVQREEF